MFRRLKFAAIKLIRTVFRIKMASSSTLNFDILPPATEPIGTYWQRLLLLAQAQGVSKLKEWRVVQARAFKTKAVSQHEYISAAVRSPDGQVHHVAIERGRGDIEKSNIRSSSNPSLTSLSARSVSDLVSPTRDAEDTISPLEMRLGLDQGKRNTKDELIFELTFEAGGRPLYLYELASLAKVVHNGGLSYLLMTNNCYHFAGSIMKSIEVAYEVENSVEGGLAGKWCGLDIYSKKKWSMELVLQDFREDTKTFVSIFLVYIIYTYLFIWV